VTATFEPIRGSARIELRDLVWYSTRLLLLRVVVLPGFALWRMGRERRTFTWVIDETTIRSTDGLGAEGSLPWSNIRRVKPARRMLWLKLKPRGWRYLLLRAFSTEDQLRLRELASRMVR
jgi:hypothetical protein